MRTTLNGGRAVSGKLLIASDAAMWTFLKEKPRAAARYLPLRERVFRVVCHRAVREDPLAVERGQLADLVHYAKRIVGEDAKPAHAGVDLEVHPRRLPGAHRRGAYELRRGEVGDWQYHAGAHHLGDLVREYAREYLDVGLRAAQALQELERLERLGDAEHRAARLRKRARERPDAEPVGVGLQHAKDSRRARPGRYAAVVPRKRIEVYLNCDPPFQV